MGLEFLKRHGGARVRSYPDQPELIDGAPDEEDGGSEGERIDHNYERSAEQWGPIDVTNAKVDEAEAPRRFVDGCHAGRTIAWLRGRDGHPIPLMLAQIGGICVSLEGHELRRTFHVVERAVSMVVDPFAWDEVEGFAAALATVGFRLLPKSLSRGGPEGDDRLSYDFEAMRKLTQNHSNYEMEVLEEAALAADPHSPTVVDGRLEPRISTDVNLRDCPLVGVIKQQRKNYLHPKGWGAFYDLEPGQRTPAFLIGSGPEKSSLPVVTWFLKLDGGYGSLPNWGVVRVEMTQKAFEAAGRDFGSVDRLSHALHRMRRRGGGYRRGPVALEPIIRAEELLRALFAPIPMLSDHFYRLTGL